MSSPPWFRFYSETIHDAKLDRVALVAEVDRVVALGAWAGLLALSNESSVRGHLLLCDGIPFTIEELANKIGIDEQSLHRIIEGFVSVKMVHWEDDTLIITNMDKRQFTSDHSTERVRKHREEKKGNDSETEVERFKTVTETPPDTETESNTDSDSELESSPPTAEIVPPPAPKKPPPEKSPLEPDTWQGRMMFAKLQANAKAKGRRGPKRFASLEQKNKFIKAVDRLDGQFEKALDAGLGNGIMAIGRLVSWLDSPKWQKVETTNAAPTSGRVFQ